MIAGLGSVATPIVQTRSFYREGELGVLIVDGVMFVGMTALAMRANRYWPIWVAALQLCSVLGHVSAGLDANILPTAYYLLTAYGAYPIWVFAVIGSVRHQQRLRAYGSDPPWRTAA